MQRRDFLSGLIAIPALSGCGYLRIDPKSVYIRSEYIEGPEQEQEIVRKAKLEYSDDGKIKVLHTQGSYYEIGFQHGYLLRKDIEDNIQYMYDQAVDRFHIEEIFDESYERLRPYIPQDYIDEMHGLAHGSKLPLRVIHGIHALPEISEWGGKKRIKNVIKKMMKGELGTSCSNLSAKNTATVDGKMYVVRILDWGLHRISRLHNYPLIHVCKPDNRIPFVNIGWIGFLGAISGMNAKGITLGEMGYGDIEIETLRGLTMPFLLREILARASSLHDVRRLIETSPPTCSYIFLMSDGKTKEAELYLRDPQRFQAYTYNTNIADRNKIVPPIKDIVWGGHYLDRMETNLKDNHGKISVEMLQNDIIPQIAMPSNFQNVIYSPEDLKFWVNNAKSQKERAAEQPYTFFDLKKALL
jgi:isopenicillin-N N-acyltransferase like protein